MNILKGIDEEFFRDIMERLEEIPFDSDRKLMSTKYRIHGVSTVFTKGALDVLLDKTIHILTEQGIRKISDEDRKKAYLNGWISKDDMLAVYEVLKKNQYGQYIKDVLDGKYIDALK